MERVTVTPGPSAPFRESTSVVDIETDWPRRSVCSGWEKYTRIGPVRGTNKLVRGVVIISGAVDTGSAPTCAAGKASIATRSVTTIVTMLQLRVVARGRLRGDWRQRFCRNAVRLENHVSRFSSSIVLGK